MSLRRTKYSTGRVANKRSTKGVSERVRAYIGMVDHDLPLYWADSLMANPASGHFVC